MKILRVVLSIFPTLGILVGPVSCDSSSECKQQNVPLTVTVVDELDQPLEGATVTAMNLSSGKVITELTASDGTTSIGDAVGVGNVRIYADRGEYVGYEVYVEWTCEECRCGPELPRLTIKLGRSVTCTANYVVLPIEVVDTNGSPVVGAKVTATNLRDGRVLSGTTGPYGTTDIGESIGAGTSQIVASFQARESAPTNVEWKCNECHCIPEIDVLRLVIP